MYFEIQGNIEDIEPIAIGNSIRELARLKKQYGHGRWRKLKGMANVQLANGHIRRAEVHWYEAHGVGKRKARGQVLILARNKSQDLISTPQAPLQS